MLTSGRTNRICKLPFSVDKGFGLSLSQQTFWFVAGFAANSDRSEFNSDRSESKSPVCDARKEALRAESGGADG